MINRGLGRVRGCVRAPIQEQIAVRLFMWVKNRSLARNSGDEFPGGSYDANGVHPSLVLEKIGNYGCTCCPCTSKPKPQKSIIPAQTRTHPMGKKVPLETFILHQITFNPDDEFWDDANELGVVPEHNILGDAYKDWKRR